MNLLRKPSVIHFEDSLMRSIMKKKESIVQIGLLSVFVVLLSSCLAIDVKQNVKNPHRYFRKAYSQIERIHKHYPNREGRPHSLHVLIYDGSHRKLIRATAPIWVANSCKDLGKAAQEAQGFDFEDEYDMDWDGINDLGQIGPGLLFELSDQKSKILIWLE